MARPLRLTYEGAAAGGLGLNFYWLQTLCSRTLQVFCGLNQREIGKALSIGSGAEVSKQLCLLDEAFRKDKQLRSWWDKIEMRIRKARIS